MNKEQGSKNRAQSWLGVWELADWIDRVLAEHFQTTKSYLSFGLQM